MRLSWNEVRARAAAFAEEWKAAAYEKGETQSFYNAFFQVFGVKRRSVARYEAHVAKLANRSGFIDLFWPGVLIVEQKSAGRDLKAAYAQAGDYCDALPERERPRYILVSDFRTFHLYDLDEGDTVAFPLADLPGHVEAFGFILGVQRRPGQTPFGDGTRPSLPGYKPGKTAGGGGSWSGSKPGWAASPLQPNQIDPDQGTTTLQARAPGKGWSQGAGPPTISVGLTCITGYLSHLADAYLSI